MSHRGALRRAEPLRGLDQAPSSALLEVPRALVLDEVGRSDEARTIG